LIIYPDDTRSHHHNESGVHHEVVPKANDLTKPFDVFSATANFKAYQRRLPEVAQAYMQLPFEFAQRLAQVKSPFEIPSVLADLATKQFTILQNLVIPNQSSR
jgi:hypothetical protein